MCARQNDDKDTTRIAHLTRWRRTAALTLVAGLATLGGIAAPTAAAEEQEPLPSWAQCVVPIPESWQQAIDEAPEVWSGYTMLLLRDVGSVRVSKGSVVLEMPGEEPRLIHESETPIEKPVTDGRHIVFKVGTDIFTWDSEHPEEPARIVSLDPLDGSRREFNSTVYEISEGQLWYRTKEQDYSGGVTIMEANLDEGKRLEDAQTVLGIWFGPAYKGMLQYTTGYYEVRLAGPFHSSSTLLEPSGEAFVVNHSGDVHLLNSDLWGIEEGKLWVAGTKDYTVLGKDADSMAGDWVSVGSGRLYNHRTKALVQLPEGLTPYLAGQGTAAYLELERDYSPEWLEIDDMKSRTTLRLSDLSEVSCPQQ